MSRAKELSKLIERNLREEEAGSDLGMAQDDAQKEMPLDPEKSDAQPEAGKIVEQMMKQPKGMCEFLEAMDAMIGRYMDPEDKEVYSPESDADKEKMQKASECMKEARSHLMV